MSENQIIAVMAAIIYAGSVEDGGYTPDESIKLAVTLYDKALTAHERYSKPASTTPPAPSGPVQYGRDSYEV